MLLQTEPPRDRENALSPALDGRMPEIVDLLPRQLVYLSRRLFSVQKIKSDAVHVLRLLEGAFFELGELVRQFATLDEDAEVSACEFACTTQTSVGKRLLLGSKQHASTSMILTKG